jgi:hypothetical protein
LSEIKSAFHDKTFLFVRLLLTPAAIAVKHHMLLVQLKSMIIMDVAVKFIQPGAF